MRKLVFRWGSACVLLEDLVEVLAVVEATVVGNTFYRPVAVLDKDALGLFDA